MAERIFFFKIDKRKFATSYIYIYDIHYNMYFDWTVFGGLNQRIFANFCVCTFAYSVTADWIVWIVYYFEESVQTVLRALMMKSRTDIGVFRARTVFWGGSGFLFVEFD